MKYTKLDREYCVIQLDGENNHPLLSWGNTDFTVFFEAEPIEEKKIKSPSKS